MGDVLVVAINSDKSMARIKEQGRPILDETERVSLVSALRPVDYVVLFDEPDISRVLEVLRPAIHTKDPKNHSTRDIINRILSTEK